MQDSSFSPHRLCHTYSYPPEIIHGNVYRDGGLLADNVPIYPMTSVGADNLIVVKLEPDDKVDTSLYSKFKEVVEIIPSREIGDLFDGTLEFTSRNVMFRMLLGSMTRSVPSA